MESRATFSRGLALTTTTLVFSPLTPSSSRAVGSPVESLLVELGQGHIDCGALRTHDYP